MCLICFFFLHQQYGLDLFKCFISGFKKSWQARHGGAHLQPQYSRKLKQKDSRQLVRTYKKNYLMNLIIFSRFLQSSDMN